MRSEGSMFQMSLAYSLIVRSLENFPEAAMFLSTMVFQAFGFCEQYMHMWPRAQGPMELHDKGHAMHIQAHMGKMTGKL